MAKLRRRSDPFCTSTFNPKTNYNLGLQLQYVA